MTHENSMLLPNNYIVVRVSVTGLNDKYVIAKDVSSAVETVELMLDHLKF